MPEFCRIRAIQQVYQIYPPMELANILNRPLTPPKTPPPPPSTPPPRTSRTTRDQRLQAQTLRDVGFTYAQIREQLGLTFDQIQYAINHRITPQTQEKTLEISS
jgi:hypothetical protein